MSEYTREVLKVVVAKICQTIGWHSIQTTPLEIMVDILRRYLQELTKLTNAYSTQFGHTQPNLDELGLAFRDMHISIADLEEYVRYVDSVAPMEIPQFPVRKESHLNFLKPGSSEVVKRPVHIHEHLPPMLPEVEETDPPKPVIKTEDIQSPPSTDMGTAVFKRPADISPNDSVNKRPRLVMEEEGRPTREISSVMMTTSGFLSPAREGKLPEARTPINTMENSSLSSQPGGMHSESRFDRKGAKIVKDFKKVDKRKDKTSKELFKPLVDEIAAKKFSTMKDVMKLKAMKATAANNANAALQQENAAKASTSKASPAVSKQTKAAQKAIKTEKPFAPSPTPAVPKPVLPPPSEKVEGKLPSEPDKLKLNIFKKISKVKDDKIEKPDKVKIKEEARTGDSGVMESRESSPDLIIDESDKNWDQSKSGASKNADVTIKQEPVEKPSKVAPAVDVTNKIYDIKSPHSEKDFLYDDDISPPGTPSTPKTPEMPSHSPPLKVEKEVKRKRKEKSKLKNRAKVPRYSMSPRRNKNENFDAELDRPKTPDDPINLVKEEAPPVPIQPTVPPMFSFFPGFIPGGPGLIPTSIPNQLFPRLPLAAGLPKHGFGQPAHIPPAMPALPFVPPVKQPVEEIFDKPPAAAVAEPPVKPEKTEAPVPGPKEKHKKDKKDKIKKKNKKDKIKNKSEKKKLREEKKDKIKKEKKDKKKEKEREHEGSVPKLTLKLGGSPRPPTPDVQVTRKIMIKPVVKKEEEPTPSTSTNPIEAQDKREPSPELARISALITRPPKLKASKEAHGTKEESGTPQTSTSPKQSGPLPGRSRINANANKGATAANSAAAGNVKAVPGKQKPVLVKQQQSSIVDKDGNKVWICPACGGQDDGSPMIGCDDCDAWYHWVCVGIQVPPDDSEDWYCRVCIVKKQETLQIDKKKKRKKKERKEH